MSGKGEKSPPSFLEGDTLREILKKGSETLLISAEDHLIEKAAKLIESMEEDLVKIMNMPLKHVDIFRSRETLSLSEIDEFYINLEKDLNKITKLTK